MSERIYPVDDPYALAASERRPSRPRIEKPKIEGMGRLIFEARRAGVFVRHVGYENNRPKFSITQRDNTPHGTVFFLKEKLFEECKTFLVSLPDKIQRQDIRPPLDKSCRAIGSPSERAAE